MFDRLARNWPLKLLSFLLAFAFWVSVTSEPVLLQNLDVPLDIRLPEGFTFTDPPPASVRLRLRGPESVMARLDPLRPDVEVDLEEVTTGDRTVILRNDDVKGLPRGLNVIRIEPDRITLHIEKTIRKVVGVEPTFVGEPPAGFVLYGARVMPPSVPVEGPRSAVEPLETLRTDPILLDDRREPFTIRVAVALDTPNLRVLYGDLLEVRVEVDRAPEERVVEDVAVQVAGLQPGSQVELRPERVRVRVSGPPALVQRLGPSHLQAVVDASGLASAGTWKHLSPTVQVRNLTPGERMRVKVVAVEPRRIRARRKT